jgi:hypothetical protein
MRRLLFPAFFCLFYPCQTWLTMNETTLNALINLFALFSAIAETRKEEAIRNFSLYLKLHLGIIQSEEYEQLFEELIDFYLTDSETTRSIDLNEQANRISMHIRGRLKKNEQVMVFLRFLELARGGNTEKARQLFDTLAAVFGIDEAELQKFATFIFQAPGSGLDSPDFLVISSEEPAGKTLFKHIFEKNLSGRILFMQSP